MRQAGACQVLSSKNQIMELIMKKIIKISFAAFAFLLFFLNVSLNLEGNKVKGIEVSMQTKVAAAFWCWYDEDRAIKCYPTNSGIYCGSTPTMG